MGECFIILTKFRKRGEQLSTKQKRSLQLILFFVIMPALIIIFWDFARHLMMIYYIIIGISIVVPFSLVLIFRYFRHYERFVKLCNNKEDKEGIILYIKDLILPYAFGCITIFSEIPTYLVFSIQILVLINIFCTLELREIPFTSIRDTIKNFLEKIK